MSDTSPEKVEELARRMAREAFQARLIDAGPVEVEYMRPYAVLLLEARRSAESLCKMPCIEELLGDDYGPGGCGCGGCVGRALFSKLESL